MAGAPIDIVGKIEQEIQMISTSGNSQKHQSTLRALHLAKARIESLEKLKFEEISIRDRYALAILPFLLSNGGFSDPEDAVYSCFQLADKALAVRRMYESVRGT